MKVTFNPQFNIKSYTQNIKTQFRGSFNIPLDAYVPQEPKEKEGPQPTQRVKNITKTFKIGSENDFTAVKMWAMSEEDSKSQIPQTITNALKGTNALPCEDIFMAGGITNNNHFYIVFNSYYYDQETDKNSVQYYCLVSTTDKPTKLQKAIMNTFNDNEARSLLKRGSVNNPYEKISEFADVDSRLFEIYTYGLAALSKETPLEDMLQNDNTPSPVIYSGDGKYIKFKVMKLDLSSL